MRGLTAAALAVTLLGAAEAQAGGLYYADRGVRPLGRAGAFVAGADDLGALAYNPAGLYDAGGQVLVDGSWVHFTSDYQRVSLSRQTDPNTGAVVGRYRETSPTVKGSTPFLPIPTLAASFRPHRDWVLGLGAWAPYAALTSYPSTVAGQPAPQRYSLVTLDGSLLAFVGAGAAWSPRKELRVGATIGMLTGVFKTQATFAGCVPERFLCAPEQPSWDVLAQLDAGPIFAPTGSVGVQVIPTSSWRFGASFQLPVWVRSHATLKTRLPQSPVFERAKQEGSDGEIAFDLPWVLRAGVEMRAVPHLRVELAGKVERWSMHDAITMTPSNIALTDVAGFPRTYRLPPVTLPRHFRDSWSAQLGAEYHIGTGALEWDVRGGVSYESSAIPKAYLSVLTIDQDKVTASVGGSVYWRAFRLDVVYAHVFGLSADVDPSEAKIALISPVQANAPKSPTYINGGHYAARADVLGLGLTYTYDPQVPPPPGR